MHFVLWFPKLRKTINQLNTQFKMRKYTSAPLPFMGQKRRFVKKLETTLLNFPDDAIYIDLFGGSGLLSHVVKYFKPGANVIYNDYDDYLNRVRNIKLTNELIFKIRQLTYNLSKGQKIPAIAKQKILNVIAEASNAGFVDYLTLSTQLLFSMKYVLNFDELQKETFYNMVTQKDYDATGYLEGVEITRKDYKELFNLYKEHENVVFLVDPPYLSTETKSYKLQWDLKDYLNVLEVLKDQRYIYFTSNKSNIVELCEWIGSTSIKSNPFVGANITTVSVTMNYNSYYTDIMLYK